MQERQELSPYEEEKLAIGRIAATPDGLLLHRYLRRVLEAVWEVDDPGALQRHTGRRTFARDLMQYMAETIESNVGRSSTSNNAILARPGSAVRARPRRGAGRRVGPDTVVGGWNDPYDPGPRNGGAGGPASNK